MVNRGILIDSLMQSSIPCLDQWSLTSVFSVTSVASHSLSVSNSFSALNRLEKSDKPIARQPRYFVQFAGLLE
jgi:hypothetical protein